MHGHAVVDLGPQFGLTVRRTGKDMNLVPQVGQRPGLDPGLRANPAPGGFRRILLRYQADSHPTKIPSITATRHAHGRRSRIPSPDCCRERTGIPTLAWLSRSTRPAAGWQEIHVSEVATAGGNSALRFRHQTFPAIALSRAIGSLFCGDRHPWPTAGQTPSHEPTSEHLSSGRGPRGIRRWFPRASAL